jgi:hypothetical protein
MTNNNSTPDIFATVKKLVIIYGVASALVLATVAAVAIGHGSVSVFMWVRAAILLLAAPLLYSWALRAAEGQPQGLERLRKISLVLPIAIVVIDAIPGICPGWYAWMQAVAALALVAVTVLTRTGTLRTPRAREN